MVTSNAFVRGGAFGPVAMINHFERAFRAWPIFVERARAKTPISYGELAAGIGIHVRPIRYVLGVIQDYCIEEELPPLTILVEHKADHSPGTGFVAWDMDDLERGRAEVYSFPWSLLNNPFRYAADGSTERDLVALLAKNPGSASDVFARVKVRGMAQIIFRRLLLTTYNTRCAFCGLSFADALEAAHLIPWIKASQEQRLDPRNGVLLCSTRHRLFDAGTLTITKSGVIKYYDPDL